jgi:hypothetical protein
LRKRSEKIDAEEGRAVPSQRLVNGNEAQRPLSDYLVGPFLDEALSKDDANSISIHWPFEESSALERKGKQKEVVDWRGREVILYVP